MPLQRGPTEHVLKQFREFPRRAISCPTCRTESVDVIRPFNNNKTKWYIRYRPVSFIFDSGADISLVGKTVADTLAEAGASVKKLDAPLKVKVVGDVQISVKESLKVYITDNNGTEISTTLYVTGVDGPSALVRDVLDRYHILSINRQSVFV
jgi:hypothetical protein